MTYRIRNWDSLFENAESRKLKTLKWVAMPNRMNTQGYTALLDHPNGAAHFGAWCAIVEICSAREPRALRGVLPESDGTIPGISRALGRISRLPGKIFEELLPRLIDDPDIQWIERVAEISGKSPEVPGKSPGIPRDSGEEGKGITGNNRGGEGREVALARLPEWANDPVFSKLVQDYQSTGAAVIDEDFIDAYRFGWKPLDWEQKADRVRSLSERMDEYRRDPRFVPKPEKFLKQEWKRAIKPPPSSINGRKPTGAEAMMELVQQRIARGQEPL